MPAVTPRPRASVDDEPVRKRPKDRADRILAAAAQLFRERGYHDVGIDEIGEAVGITGPAVYRHFKGKEALLVGAAERSIAQFGAAYADAVAASDDPDEQLEGLVRATMAGTLDDRDLVAVYLRETRHLSGEPRAKLQAAQRSTFRYWMNALSRIHPGITPTDATYRVQAVTGVAQSLVSYQPSLSRARLEDVLTRAGMAALHADVHPFVGVDHAPRGRAAAKPDGRMLRRASRREAILSASVRLWREHGFSGVGIDDIGAAADITGPGVYRHFLNKEDVLDAAFNRATEQLAAAATRALAGATTSADALERLVGAYADLVMEQGDLVAVYLSEAHALSPDRQAVIRRAQRAFIDDWVAVLRQSRPKLGDGEVRVIVHSALGMMNAFAVHPPAASRTAVRPFVVAMPLAALRA